MRATASESCGASPVSMRSRSAGLTRSTRMLPSDSGSKEVSDRGDVAREPLTRRDHKRVSQRPRRCVHGPFGPDDRSDHPESGAPEQRASTVTRTRVPAKSRRLHADLLLWVASRGGQESA